MLQLKEGHNEININEKLIEMGLAIRHHGIQLIKIRGVICEFSNIN